MTGVGDPVGSGFATSLARPAGNITGVSFGMGDIALKQLEVLRAVVPTLAGLAILVDGVNPASPELARPIQAAARQSGLASELVLVLSLADIQGAFRSHRGAFA